MMRRATDTGPSTRLRWILATLPLAPVALFAYLAFEWLFFITKPSFVSILPAYEQLLVLLTAPAPFVAPVLIVQCVATVLSLVVYPRFRAIAVVPAAAVLSALVLILADNFLYAIARMSLIRSDLAGRVIYALVLAIALAVWMSKLRSDVPRAAGSGRSIALLWLPAGAVLAAAAATWMAAPPALLVAPAADRPNILLLSIDGVDAERLSAYGYAKPTSPFLASLRDQTLFCENAFSNAIQTYTSQTSFLTGKLPLTTRVIVPPSILRGDDSEEHLPAILRSAGYRSIQLSLRHIADAEDSNMRLGFELTNYRWENRFSGQAVERLFDRARPFRLAAIDRFHARYAALAGAKLRSDQFAHVTGDEVNPYWSDDRRVETLAWFIARPDSRPWFAHVHLLDTHGGYHDRSAAGVATNEEQYDALLREGDERVRRIFTILEARAALDRTIVVVTTDHGSSERFARVPRIPLMIRFPEGRHARRVPENTQLLDVAPTVLEAAGIAAPAWMEGRSLLRPPGADRPLFASGTVGSIPARGLFRLALPGPPHFGASSVQMVIGSWWYSLDLATGAMTSEPVEGHTVPVPQPGTNDARALLENWLTRSGLNVPERNR